MENRPPQMSQETLLARVDERTISISKKLDEFCGSYKETQLMNNKRLGALERWRALLIGAYSLGVIVVGGLFTLLLTMIK
jgi:hypothetical protein